MPFDENMQPFEPHAWRAVDGELLHAVRVPHDLPDELAALAAQLSAEAADLSATYPGAPPVA